jgi:hypothetical protein
MSAEIETIGHRGQIEPAGLNEKSTHEHVGDIHKDDVQFKADAMEAENSEHAMTVLQAVRAYPMACLWAFIMSSTIVSPTLFLVDE